ncbi:MAG: glycine-rich domain-containing protein [Planctomycetota bacterium]
MLATAPHGSAVDAVLELLRSLDLSMVKQKLMDEEEGQGWTRQMTDIAEQRYHRYLCMLYMDPNGSIVPTSDIDLFWHQHILDTRAYARDCERVFGYFVHHFPYFGMRSEEDAKDLAASFEKTKVFYRHLFGEDYCGSGGSESSSSCHKGPGNCHKCYSGPGPMSCKTCKSQ